MSRRPFCSAVNLDLAAFKENNGSPGFVPPVMPAKKIDHDEFSAASPVDRVKMIFDVHGNRAVQLASMQRTSGVLMHLIYQAQTQTPILFFDTGYLHEETHDLRAEFIRRYGLDIRSVKPELSVAQQDSLVGKDLWKTLEGQQQCCYIRKEKPLLDALSEIGAEATISGMMRSQGGARQHMQCIDSDDRLGTLTYNPLFDWTNQMLHDYSAEHNVPIHALYSRGYTSIGCQPCTTPIQPGEDDRAGRWRHLREASGQTHMYCGMNNVDIKIPSKPKSTGGYLKKRASPAPTASVPVSTSDDDDTRTGKHSFC
eukprot:CAMPEP_0175154516 /NCGR_PEP_ID=MMETSP0087-20121206/20392_1 /TAXON_ID=136419 /ORGANISM="Unknown Unknown, Strain D1" /LENGTH=311 /DNA_ID=CAMNT_0016441427 /DNA_START=40 /DNA_END=975 /DNA_ORIENTATION=+